jgi:hypothetical protein
MKYRKKSIFLIGFLIIFVTLLGGRKTGEIDLNSGQVRYGISIWGLTSISWANIISAHEIQSFEPTKSCNNNKVLL